MSCVFPKAQADLKPHQDPKRVLMPQAKPPAPAEAHSKPAAKAMHARPASPANQAVKAAPRSSFEPAFRREEADMPLAAFPSTQESTSQQASKLIGKTAAASVDQAAPGLDASAVASGQQAEQRLHSRQQPQQLLDRQAQQQGQKSLKQLRPEQSQRPGHLRPPALSPSGSSTVRPPQSLRRRSGIRKADSLDLDRLADKDQRDQAGKPSMITATPDAEAAIIETGRNVNDQGQGSQLTAVAARGKGAQGGDAIPVTAQARVSGGRKASDGEWITRRSASPGQVHPDAPALLKAPSKQELFTSRPGSRIPRLPSQVFRKAVCILSHQLQIGLCLKQNWSEAAVSSFLKRRPAVSNNWQTRLKQHRLPRKPLLVKPRSSQA